VENRRLRQASLMNKGTKYLIKKSNELFL
jgi:hypothetical protein